MKQKQESVELIDNLYRMSRILADAEKHPRHYGTDMLLYPNEVYTLRTIARNEGINQKELSEEMFRTKGATSMVVQQLVKKGLIEKRVNASDQRNSELYPTTMGYRVFTTHLEYDQAYINMLVKLMDVDMEEMTEFNRMIRLMTDLLVQRRKDKANDFV